MTDPLSAPTRTGAHRPRRSPIRDVLPTLAVLLAVVAIGLGAWALTRSTASNIQSSGSDDGVVSSGQGAVPTGPTAGSTGASSSPSATASGSSPTSETSTTSSPPAGTVDKDLPVTVLNATRTTGLAGSVAETLRSSGWTVPTTDNYRKSRPPTTVFYGDADQRATAEAVAEDVGGDPEVEQTDEFGSDCITVVLGSDYAG
jgi:hypothetical protein